MDTLHYRDSRSCCQQRCQSTVSCHRYPSDSPSTRLHCCYCCCYLISESFLFSSCGSSFRSVPPLRPLDQFSLLSLFLSLSSCVVLAPALSLLFLPFLQLSRWQLFSWIFVDAVE